MRYSDFSQRLKKMIEQAKKERWNESKFDREVEVLSNNYYASAKTQLVQNLRQKYNAIFTLTNSEISDMIVNALKSNANQFALTNRGIITKVSDIFSDSLKENKNYAEIRGRIEGVIGTFRNYSETITRTAYNAFNQLSRFEEVEKVNRFTFVGPPASRPFCRLLMQQAENGRTWTLKEIRNMNNGQGLPVESYCGGWNCRHQWEIA